MRDLTLSDYFMIVTILILDIDFILRKVGVLDMLKEFKGGIILKFLIMAIVGMMAFLFGISSGNDVAGVVGLVAFLIGLVGLVLNDSDRD